MIVRQRLGNSNQGAPSSALNSFLTQIRFSRLFALPIRLSGDARAVSRMGQEQLDDILTYPGARIAPISKGNFAGGRYYIAPDGRGAAFDSSGTFQYFGTFR